jgi:hypothetical protein
MASASTPTDIENHVLNTEMNHGDRIIYLFTIETMI